MKVLSLKEPFASLIKEQKKLVETRSWKTTYRGELYIHASITKIKTDERTKELLALLEAKELNYGHIICKCKLVDCIYMTIEYVNEMKSKNNQEYICGEYKEGRYAWILSDIEPIKMIKAKGELGIWNYYDMSEVMNLMQDISYGWVDKLNNKHGNTKFADEYKLQSPKETLKNKVGVCWDQVELERYYFKNRDVKTYFLCHYDNNNCPTHTFIVIKEQDKYYWFEHAWEVFRGIHEYNTLKELLMDVKSKFIAKQLNNNFIKDNLILREYKKPSFGISVEDFYRHCEKENDIIIS